MFKEMKQVETRVFDLKVRVKIFSAGSAYISELFYDGTPIGTGVGYSKATSLKRAFEESEKFLENFLSEVNQ